MLIKDVFIEIHLILHFNPSLRQKKGRKRLPFQGNNKGSAQPSKRKVARHNEKGLLYAFRKLFKTLDCQGVAIESQANFIEL